MLLPSTTRHLAIHQMARSDSVRPLAQMVGAVLCAMALCSHAALAQSTPPPPTVAVDASTPTAFTTVVKAPPSVQKLLQNHLNIQRFHGLPDLDEQELRRLVNQLPADARSLLGTLGHFSADVSAGLVREPTDDPAKPVRWTVQVDVTPGPISHVGTVLVAFAPEDFAPPTAIPARSQAMQARVREEWQLPTGRGFTQTAWDDAKAHALRALTVDGFPNARLVGSLADVDTEANQVNLAVEIATGPLVILGPVEVEGLSRYDRQWIENLVRASGVLAGNPYRLQDLQVAQQRLAQSGYFDSVFVYVDPGADPSAAPIRVQVREATRGRLSLGVGVSTDSGPRLSAEHVWNRVPGLDWRANSKLKLEQDDRLLQTELRSPVDEGGWLWSSGIKAERLQYSSYTTTSQQLRLGKAHESENTNRGYFLQYDRALTDSEALRAAGTVQAQQALSANYLWSRTRFDAMPLPTRGHGLAAEAGAGVTLGTQRDPFLRARVRWQGLLPLDGLWQLNPLHIASSEKPTTTVATGPRLGRLSLRAEGGAIVGSPLAAVPDSLRFWAGGDQSVRGYGPRELGVEQTDGSVRPGRLMVTSSVEWQRPILSAGVPTAWESTLFVDAGAVADTVAGMHAKVGVGAGARYNSPAGPLQFDLAYGLSTKRFRLHMSVGFTF